MKRIAAALSVVALIGCGTAQKKADAVNEAPKKEETTSQTGTGGRAAVGAVGGAGVGAVMCLSVIPAGLAAGPPGVIGATLFAIVCLPVGLVAGAVVGGVAGAARSPTVASTTSTSTDIGARSAAPRVEAALQQPEWKLIGKLEKNEALPEGTLHVARAYQVTADETAARLLVDFDGPTDRGERSYMASAKVNCRSGSVEVYARETYSEAGANGWRVTSEVRPDGRLVVVEKPTATLAEAIQRICE